MNGSKLVTSTKGRIGRWAAYGTSTAVLAVTAMMVLSPAASGASIVKPFKGWGASVQLSVGQSGCSTGKVIKFPSWMKKSGTFRFAGSADSPHCGSSSTGNSAQSDGNFGLAGILPFSTSGNHTISAVWSVTYSAMWNLTPYKHCALNYAASYSVCAAYAEDTVYGYIFVTDESNSTWGTYGYGYAIGGFVDLYNYTTVQNYSQNYCYLGNCTHYGGNLTYSHGGGMSGSFAGTIPVVSTLNLSGTSAINRHDTYLVNVYFDIFVDSGAYTQQAVGKGTPNAFASADVATHGNKAVLQGIVVT